MVSNLAQFHLSFNKAHNFTSVKCGYCLSFFLWFGNFIKTQLNLDLFVQPTLLLQRMFLSGYVPSSKLCFLQLMTLRCLNSKEKMFLVIVVGFSKTL